MPNWFKDNAQSIDHTPLVRLNRITNDALAIVPGKIEGRNPAYSVKCCISAAENAGKTIDVILPDSGERYLSSILFEGLFTAEGLRV